MDCLIKSNRQIINCKKYSRLINYIHEDTENNVIRFQDKQSSVEPLQIQSKELTNYISLNQISNNIVTHKVTCYD